VAWHQFEYKQPGGKKKLALILALAGLLLVLAFVLRSRT
jgi:hypothetical protein